MSGEGSAYLNFSVDDFVWDDSFRSWVNSPNEESELYWKNWLRQHPQKAATIETARQIVLALNVQSNFLGLSEVESEVDEIIRKRDAGFVPLEGGTVRRFRFSVVWKIAAVLILIVGATLLFIPRKTNVDLSTVATTSGIQKKVLLSDSSSVILNSNSKISFRKKWKASDVRELWMEGEGYFEVKHLDKDNQISNHERFIVHVNNVTVEVLGTTFNIRNRRNRTEIVLKEGSVRLSFADQQADIMMQPGEIVTVTNNTSNTVSISKVTPDEYSAWIHQKLILNNTHLSDIIEYLEDNYSKKIILSDSSLRNKRIEGTLMLDNLDDALFILSKVLKVKIEQNDSSIYFIKM